MGYDIPADHGGPIPTDAANAAAKDQESKEAALRSKLEGVQKKIEAAQQRAEVSVKDPYNPKDAVGVKKWRQYTTVPLTVVWELGVALLEGARKYGRHNYRVAPVRASVYIDAAKGHLDCWWEGEDIDDESGLSHITKAMASLTVLRDAMVQKKMVDDRPPATDMKDVKARLQQAVDLIFERIPEAKPAFTETSNPSGNKGGAE